MTHEESPTHPKNRPERFTPERTMLKTDVCRATDQPVLDCDAAVEADAACETHSKERRARNFCRSSLPASAKPELARRWMPEYPAGGSMWGTCVYAPFSRADMKRDEDGSVNFLEVLAQAWCPSGLRAIPPREVPEKLSGCLAKVTGENPVTLSMVRNRILSRRHKTQSTAKTS